MLEIFITRQRDANGKTVTELERIEEIVPDCWINLSSPTEDELERVQAALDLPPEFLRYPLDEEERPRIDVGDEPEQTLILADLPIVRKEGASTKYETMPIGIIVVGHKAIVTISLREASVLETFMTSRVRDFRTGYRTRFAFQILHAIAKDFLKYLRFIDKTLESTERQLNKSVSNKELFKLMELGKSLVYFSTSLKSNEAVLEKLMRGKTIKQYEEDQDLLEDVIIENRQAMEMAGTYASIINGTLDANASIISNNLNVVMKFLAAVTIVFSIPTVVSSLFGMNIPLPTNPEFAGNPWPFAIVCAVILLFGGLVTWWLWKKDMF
jgi:magnesium transporter